MHLLPIVALALLAGSAAPPQLRVRQVSRAVHPRLWGDGPERRVELPYFDPEERLRWDDALVAAAGGCTPASFPGDVPADARCERRTAMRAPRVDACRCFAATPGGTHAAVLYVGAGSSARATSSAPFARAGR